MIEMLRFKIESQVLGSGRRESYRISYRMERVIWNKVVG
jgi:hypothetical protein